MILFSFQKHLLPSTVGFDTLYSALTNLENAEKSIVKYPPYNIKKIDDDSTKFTIVLRRNNDLKVVLSGDKINQINTTDLPNGDYLIEIADQDKYITARKIRINNFHD